mgnify:CR=1 FL=1|jgi:hypothetical protein
MTRFAVRHMRSLLSRAGYLLLGLVFVVSLSACGDDMNMQGPTVDQQVSVDVLRANQDPVDIANLSDVFSGPNLSFRASSSASGVASASVEGNTLTVNPQSAGEATVSVVATNDAGEAELSSDVTVILPDAPAPPEQ